MTSPEDREKRLRRMKRNEAAKSLRNFKPQRIPNKKKLAKNEPPEIEDDDPLDSSSEIDYIY